jgi:hypothetical protein
MADRTSLSDAESTPGSPPLRIAGSIVLRPAARAVISAPVQPVVVRAPPRPGADRVAALDWILFQPQRRQRGGADD